MSGLPAPPQGRTAPVLVLCRQCIRYVFEGTATCRIAAATPARSASAIATAAISKSRRSSASTGPSNGAANSDHAAPACEHRVEKN